MARIYLITGRIGSGKSTLSVLLQQRGFFVIRLDDFAKGLMTTDEAKLMYLKLFGKDALNDDLSVNLEYLRNNFFTPQNNLKRQDFEVFVWRKFHDYLFDYVRPMVGPVFVEAAETPFCVKAFSQLDDYVGKIVVQCDEDVRIARVKKRSGLTEEQIKERDALQYDSPITDKDICITNEGSVDNLDVAVRDMLNDKIRLTLDEHIDLFHTCFKGAPPSVMFPTLCCFYRKNKGCLYCPIPCKEPKQKIK